MSTIEVLLNTSATEVVEKLFPGRVAVTIQEFCDALGWNRARWYRHRKKIASVGGFGNPLIPVNELIRILEEAAR